MEEIIKEERERIEKMSCYEKKIREKGFEYVAGIDEVGRGPLAGPVVAAACILPANFSLKYINDSKKLTPKMREKLFFQLLSNKEIYYGYGVIDAETIDEVNILEATFLAMKQAIFNLPKAPDYILFDGNQMPDIKIPKEGIIKGDSLSISIAAASIIAKHLRDKIMEGYHEKFPKYYFHEHKGYGTKKHMAAINQHGPCKIHRRSFEPIKSLVEKMSSK